MMQSGEPIQRAEVISIVFYGRSLIVGNQGRSLNIVPRRNLLLQNVHSA
jgi:hypothetical protein